VRTNIPLSLGTRKDSVACTALVPYFGQLMTPSNSVRNTAGSAVQALLLDLLELTKLELTGLSVLTALCGFYIAAETVDVARLIWTAIGTWLVGAAAGVFNQFQERAYDGLMKRTERRPLPAGRISPPIALGFGILLTASGAVILHQLASPLAMGLGIATVGFYIIVYTPMKRMSPLATAVGAVPGAMPPLIGWAAATGGLDVGAWLLFGLVYLWQVPHFLSIAWMYQKDYMRAGFKVLSVSDTKGTQTGVIVLLSTAVLLPESLSFYFAGTAGLLYLVGGLVLGILFLAEAWRFFSAVSESDGSWLGKSNAVSRRLFFASLVYLPIVMALLALDKK
jgi:protoheme IX farnesyltransferase